ncbi:MAG: hypothetical protein PHH54_01550 [Candidatus Nanoarchaeia archaeon]|nr:hypothetical protein [Candidatus Nanoarchaeia archaeon]MDD5740649.1 hypothetical protein [Candidatus Nanoarchaeia archaeon]
MTDKLTYEDLKLGEKAKHAFKQGKDADFIIKNCPVYLNTNPVFTGLNVTDLAIAGVLGGINSLYVGDTGTGKSQLAQDFYNYYFNGNQLQGGHAVKIRGRPELDIYEEVYRDIDKEQLRWIPNENIQAMYHFIDELNRCPEVTQNQFFGLGDGFIEHKGMKVHLGKNGYNLAVATANLGNGEFQGTFETDKALYNRLPLTLDFDYKMFQPTDEDKMIIDFLRAADPRIKEAPKRDISGLVIQAEKEIAESTRNPGLESFAVINFLKFGLNNCYNPSIQSKEKNWPYQCQDCNKNQNADSLCSLIKAPTQRTINAIIKYAAALDYLGKLKNPKQEIDAVELMFNAFELTGAYQKLLNPSILKQNYAEQNPKMIKQISEKLKHNFRQNEDFILTSLENAQRGKPFDDYYKHDKTIGDDYSKLSEKARANVQKLEPFTDNTEIGLGWVKTACNLWKTLHENNQKKNGADKNEK